MNDNIKEKKSNKFWDWIFLYIANLIAPIPVVNMMLAQSLKNNFKNILVLVFVIVLLGVMFISQGFSNPSNANNDDNFEQLPQELKGYVEEGYTPTDYPAKSPLGGNGIDWIEITAYYHDPGYFQLFHRWHDGLDIVPNNNYFNNSKAYKLTGKYIIIATMSGKACSYIDVNGGLTITIVSDNNENKTLYVHMSKNFIPINTCTTAHNGDPLGIMGMTGDATGVHVHYGTYSNQNGHWVDYDPYQTLFN